MCGRYASSRDPRDLAELFAVDRVDRVDPVDGAPGTAANGAAASTAGLPADWNVAPTKTVYAVLERSPRGHPGRRPVRRLRPVRWGLVPSWASDPKVGGSMINARVETVALRSAFRRALVARRCVLPADGYYEWYAEPDGRKTPHFIGLRTGGVLAMAGCGTTSSFTAERGSPRAAPRSCCTASRRPTSEPVPPSRRCPTRRRASSSTSPSPGGNGPWTADE